MKNKKITVLVNFYRSRKIYCVQSALAFRADAVIIKS